MKRLILALGLLVSLAAGASAADIYFDTGGCQTGSTTLCSGTTDSASATVSGSAATITCSATDGPSSAPGCLIGGSPALTGFATDGSQAIFLNAATNSNQKIFFINAVDDAADRVGTTVTPTGLTATSSDWGIGGRMIYNSANWEAAARAGDTFWFNNTPASKAADFLTKRTNGSNAGYIRVVGKTGVRPVLQVTNTNQVIDGGASYWWFENLEFDQDGASGAVVNSGAANNFVNIKWSDGGGAGLALSNADFNRVLSSEIFLGTTSGDGISATSGGSQGLTVIGTYIHENGGDGIDLGNSDGGPVTILNSIVSANIARGIYQSAAFSTRGPFVVSNSTVASNGNSGLEVTDADSPFFITNTIFYNNGDAAGEYNAEWTTSTAETIGWHAYNDFYQSGGGGAGNVSGLTINATEVTTDPLFVDAANGDFRLRAGSPARLSGFPGSLLGGSTGYMDMGAVQARPPVGMGILSIR